MFSERSSAPDAGAIESALSARRARGEPIVDLSIACPGAEPHETALREALDGARAPDERSSSTRLTFAPGGSAAHALVLALLCDPGDEVLVPQPCHPWLSALAHPLGVALVPYALRYDDAWRVDARELWEAIGERTRAIVCASPGVPTGAYLAPDELDAIGSLGVPIVLDETRRSCALEAAAPASRLAGETLVFTIGGLGALPALELAWIAVLGPDRYAREAHDRMALLGAVHGRSAAPLVDAFASLLARDEVVRESMRTHAASALAMVRAAAQRGGLHVPTVEAGWHALVRMPEGASDEAWALELLESGVLLHPGSRYELPDDERWLVLGLLTPLDELRRGLDLLIEVSSRDARDSR